MPDQEIIQDPSGETGRPRVITFLSILILLVSIFHLVKFSQAIIQWGVLATLPLTVSPLYLAGTGLIWGISGGFLSWSLWSGKPWTRRLGILISLAYTSIFWVDRIFLAEPGALQTRWPINLALTLAGLPAFYLILSFKKSQVYFNRNPVKIA